VGSSFDLDSLLGVEADLVLKHNQGDDGKTYCNVRTILRLPTAAERAEEQCVLAITEKVKQAAQQTAVQSVAQQTAAPPPATAVRTEITDEDLPF
jgi:hypothetical protein